jgi:hypothetical protein
MTRLELARLLHIGGVPIRGVDPTADATAWTHLPDHERQAYIVAADAILRVAFVYHKDNLKHGDTVRLRTLTSDVNHPLS